MTTFDKIQASKQREGFPLPLYSAAIKSARRLVGKFNKSTVATTKLKELCNKKLFADVATRWSSVYLLIRRLFQLREHVKVVCENLGWDCLSNSEWNLLSRIEILLEPFSSFPQLVRKDRIYNFSSVIPCVEELKIYLIEVRFFLMFFSHEKLEINFFLTSMISSLIFKASKTAGLIEISEALLDEMNRRFEFMLDIQSTQL